MATMINPYQPSNSLINIRNFKLILSVILVCSAYLYLISPSTSAKNIIDETKFKHNKDIISNQNSNIHEVKYESINEVGDNSNANDNIHEVKYEHMNEVGDNSNANNNIHEVEHESINEVGDMSNANNNIHEVKYENMNEVGDTSNANDNIHEVEHESINEVGDTSNKNSNIHEVKYNDMHEVKHNDMHEVKHNDGLKFMFLNVTTSDQLLTKSKQSQEYSIDILTIGSMGRISAAQKQFETWGSHPIIRNRFLATEYDDPDVNCAQITTYSHVRSYSSVCKDRDIYWKQKGLRSPLIDYFLSNYAIKWNDRSPAGPGWHCAQKRFLSSFTKLMMIYTYDKAVIFPDYLIIVDDDTYINISNIKDYLLTSPSKGVPLPTTPIIFAGCRIRGSSHHDVFKWSFPWRGYGTFISEGSLQRWTQQIDCGNLNRDSFDDIEFEKNICDKYMSNIATNSRVDPFSGTIGEKKYFEDGDSLNNVFYEYARKEQVLCMHSDWFFGYFANYLRLSTLTSNEPKLSKDFDVPGNRLHTIMNSNMYSDGGEGLCEKSCQANSTICHNIDEETMEKIYNETLRL